MICLENRSLQELELKMKERDGLSTDGELEEKKLRILLKIKRRRLERLQQRLDYENASDFYHCGNEDCSRITFENALKECSNVHHVEMY